MADRVLEKKIQSQKKRLLNFLKKKGSITKAEAYRMLGIWNTGGRIHELRREGHKIDTEMVERFGRNARKMKVAKYIYKNDEQ